MANPFPYPGDNWTSVLDMFSYANDITEGSIGVGILVFIGFISFLIAPKRGNMAGAISFTGFILLIVSIILRLLQLINDTIFYIVVIIFIGSLVYLSIRKESESV